uniref:Peptidase S1 domain-containing protein n=1 Tax=Arion vulgaris TaxID=1028688 RepID=A0A0B7A9Y2_9EUPU
MYIVTTVTWVVISCLSSHVLSQTPLCDSRLRYGGVCVETSTACPSGTFSYVHFSNYIGCFGVNQKCCANNPQGAVKYPDGIVVTPPPTCGVGSMDPSSRILDGTLTGPCDWPFSVSLRSRLVPTNDLTYQGTTHVCAGTLISPTWVLTNSACVLSAGISAADAPGNAIVVAADYNITGIDIDPLTGRQQEQVINIKSAHLHPDYRFTTQFDLVPFEDTQAINSNAVALIKLAEPITGRCSGIACLPTEAEAANNCAAYDECVITGWGFVSESFETGVKDELMLGRVRLISAAACDFLTARLNLNSSRPIGTICQSPRETNTDSCLGDEGGAVLCSNGFNWVVRAILPFNMCLNGRYNLYVTSASNYLNWIQTTMAQVDAATTG